jgi:hypothetical protein
VRNGGKPSVSDPQVKLLVEFISSLLVRPVSKIAPG